MAHSAVLPIDISPIGPGLTKAGRTAGERTALPESVVGAYPGLHRQRLLCPPRVPAACIIEMIKLRRERLKIGATACVRPGEERRVR
jgi:hypothetical protein